MTQKILLLLLLFFFNHLFANSLKNKSNLLIINSYHKGFQWSDELISGVEEAIKNDSTIKSTILYMDSKRISSKQYYDKLIDLYKIQLNDRKYDLILLVDTFAYEFAIKNYNKLFKNDEKLIFVGLERFDEKTAQEYGLKDKISGILEKRAIEDIVEIINTMMPKLKKLYIINDFSKNGDDTDVILRNVIRKIDNKIKIEYIRYSTIKDLKKKFSLYKKDEAILFIRFYNNKFKDFHSNSEIASMIDSFELPTFSTDSLFIKKGSLGGKLVQIEELGKNTGNIILKILKHKPLESFIITDKSYSYTFDYLKLKKFDLDASVLDEKITYVNAPLSFMQRNREFIDFMFIVSLILIFFVVSLLYILQLQIRNKKHQEFIIQQSKLAEIGEIISSITHQWKEPLVEISTLVQEQIGNPKKTEEENEKYLKNIMSQIFYMSNTINDFQNFIKPSSKKTYFHIKDAILKMMNIVEHNIRYSYIDININMQEETKLLVFGYKNELMQGLLNIVNNAKDSILYKRLESKNFKGQINIDISKIKNFAQIEISDNGGGLDMKNINKIFDPYYTTKEKGHGIGLYMTKLIIENKMKGFINVLNKNDGASFIIKLRLENENLSS